MEYMYMDSNSCWCHYLDDPMVATYHATHDLKLSMRGSGLWCATPVPQGVTGCSRAGDLGTVANSAGTLYLV